MDITVNWTKYIKLSKGDDWPYCTCIFDDYLAVVGFAGPRPALVLLDRNTGHIVKKWVGEGHGTFYNCFSTGNVLYVVGTMFKGVESSEGTIYVLDKELNLLNKARVPSSVFGSITCDGEYLYIGGHIRKDIDLDDKYEGIWYIEKRTKSLELVSYKELYTENWKRGDILDLGINPATGELWTVGAYEGSEQHSLIVIFDKKLRELQRIDYPSDNEYFFRCPSNVCFDNIGNAYTGGEYGVAKFDKNGNILKVNKDVGVEKIAFINGLVYIFSDERINEGWNAVLSILDSELNIIEKYVLRGMIINEETRYWISRPSFDTCFNGKNIYVAKAGFTPEFASEFSWVVYSIAVKPLSTHLWL